MSDSDNPLHKNRCVICRQLLGSKKQLLHGAKCQRFEIREKLKLILHPHDYRSLYNQNVFREPRICNLCFVTIKQIPDGISKLKDLLGEPINLHLYKPQRKNWDSDGEEERTLTHQSVAAGVKVRSGPSRQNCQLPSRERKNISLAHSGSAQKCRQKSKADSGRVMKSDNFSHDKPVTSDKLPPKDTKRKTRTRGRNMKEQMTISRNRRKVNKRAELEKAEDGSFEISCVDIDGNEKMDTAEILPDVEPPFSMATPVVSESEVAKSSTKSSLEAGDVESDFTNPCAEHALSENFRDKPTESGVNQSFALKQTIDSDTGQSEVKEKNAIRRSTRTKPFTRSRKTLSHDLTANTIGMRNTINHSQSDQNVIIVNAKSSISQKTVVEKEGKKATSKDNTKADDFLHMKNGRSSRGNKRTGAQTTVSSTSSPKRRKMTLEKGCSEKKMVRTKASKNGEASKESRKSDDTVFKDKVKVGKAMLRVDIPESLNQQSQTKLVELMKEVMSYLTSQIEDVTSSEIIKCYEKDCEHSYPLWRYLALHIKYYHNDGVLQAKDEATQTMTLLADGPASVEAKFPHKCRHPGCELMFSSEDTYQHHESLHNDSQTYFCGYPNCGQGFKLLATLQVHHRTHTGERPFVCPVRKCGKSFKHHSDLTMHKRRHAGEKPHQCQIADCKKTFTTSSELNEHTQTHHNQADAGPFICSLCKKEHKNRRALSNHRRKIHGVGKPGRYQCPYENCESWFVRRDKYELHLCTHSPERMLCCEKCGKQFGCQRYLDVHHKVHEKNEKHAAHPPDRNHVCEVSGCERRFTSRVYMKRHVISFHMGRRPRPVPGVFYTCQIEGCGRKFSLKSTLCRHNLLVHKGGDYKLNRTVVKYTCAADGCGKEFNRRNLLKEHMAEEHGLTLKQQMSADGNGREFAEEVCTECGMVLTPVRMPRHKAVQHSTKTTKDRKEETPPFTCNWCSDLQFGTREERRAHVQGHIENPPYKCEVEDCKETFFLVKNLDNHLWNHCKKVSTCEVEGCAQVFDNQLLLAKHSKIHYDGRMKCPWRNCGDWFTAMGTLKQHFLAHSRSLTARFGSDFVCQVCDRVFSSKYGLRNHQKTHEEKSSEKPSQASETELFHCEEDGCQATFGQFRNFFDHFLHHYTNIPTACRFPQCSQVLPTMLLQSKHGKSHYEGRYKCPWEKCEKTFASSFFQVKKHVYRHMMDIPEIAANRPYGCPQCDMVFRSLSNLTHHQAQHPERSDYVCTVCGKKFSHNHLKRHMLTHRQEKPHQCPHCGVRYGTVNGLKFHILQKHGIGKWPFKCNFCDKGFISSTELRRHLPSHTKEKPYSCQQCGLNFATHTGFKGHMRKHSGQKFVCEVEGCGKVYTTALSMRGHKAQHAGFSKTCHHCGKTYNNPYGHKCKASRDSRKGLTQQAPLESSRPQPVLTCPVRVNSVPVVTVTLPPVTTLQQQPLMAQPVTLTQAGFQQPATRTIIAPNTIPPPRMLAPPGSHGLPQVVQPGLGQGMTPQALPPGLANQNLIPDRTVQPTIMDMSRVAPVTTSLDVTGDYSLNNYIVFWDNHNIS